MQLSDIFSSFTRSATTLGYFEQFLATNFVTKLAQTIW